MTKDQLIERAIKSIESARLLLDSDPDLASYTVGYALECALKARFCTKTKLASFPSDRSAAKRLQVAHAFVHDLDQLLRLTDDEHIAKENYPSVDWSVAADWSVERRYSPVGTRSTEQAQAQIEETEAAVLSLCEY